jgi:uncharacterized protein (TIGR03437 family)
MNRILYRFAILFGLLICPAVAQDLGTTVRIHTSPGGLQFYVDGVSYRGPVSMFWPVGSKHVLEVPPDIEQVGTKMQYSFQGWQWSGGMVPPAGATKVTITAGPPMTDIVAQYSVQYALSLNYFVCYADQPCNPNGTIYVNGTPYNGNQDIYFGPNSQVTLIAVPNQGYVFAGWLPGGSQSITNAVNTVTMTSPMTVYPIFKVARTINLATSPEGFSLYADRLLVSSPQSYQWGWSTLHSVGVVSPQQDSAHQWWTFSSWSDGGAANHAYSVAETNMPDTLTATFIPALIVGLRTVPDGLPLTVDGRSDWSSYNFIWGIGDTHRLEAPAQLTDSKGRVWAFSSWSDGGTRVHDYTMPSVSPAGGVVVATYTQMAHMTISSPMNGLTVKVDGNDCGMPCDLVRPVGAAVKLSAPASLAGNDTWRYDFDGWPGSGSFASDWAPTLGQDPLSLNLTYHLMNRLTTAATPSDGASWSLQPYSADGFYNALATVTITVAAQPGYRFRNWAGDLSGTAPSASLSMNSPRQVQAMLDRAPYISPAGVANAAAATPQSAVAPGSIVSIFGASLADAQAIGPDSPLSQALDCASVQVAGRLLPLFFVSPTQINAQMPDDLQPGPQNVTVSCTGMPDVQAPFTLVRNAPGLFQQPSGGQNFAVATHEDGSPVTVDAPAKSGELLSLYGTGFGPADHPRPVGFAIPATPPFRIVDLATVNAAGAAITPEKVFAAPGRVGVDVIQFRLGDGAPTGTNAQLYITVNGQDSNTVVLPVQ